MSLIDGIVFAKLNANNVTTSSTTLQDDPTLQCTLEADTRYRWLMINEWYANDSGDWKRLVSYSGSISNGAAGLRGTLSPVQSPTGSTMTYGQPITPSYWPAGIQYEQNGSNTAANRGYSSKDALLLTNTGGLAKVARAPRFGGGAITTHKGSFMLFIPEPYGIYADHPVDYIATNETLTVGDGDTNVLTIPLEADRDYLVEMLIGFQAGPSNAGTISPVFKFGFTGTMDSALLTSRGNSMLSYSADQSSTNSWLIWWSHASGTLTTARTPAAGASSTRCVARTFGVVRASVAGDLSFVVNPTGTAGDIINVQAASTMWAVPLN